MPLESGKSETAFSNNVAELMKAGHSQKQALAIAYKESGKDNESEPGKQESSREIDVNGFITIERNPISRSGIFEYRGSSIGAPDPDKIYKVYRPAEELSNPEAIESFKLIPFVDNHTMLGPEEEGFVPAEMKGVHGSTGEEVEFSDNVLFAKIKIFSQYLKNMLQDGKRELSLGYRCRYKAIKGMFNGEPYDYIQTDLRGNHLALVDAARCNVAVLDHKIAYDHFDLNIKELTMTPEEQKAKDAEEKMIADKKAKDAAEEEKKMKDAKDAEEKAKADKEAKDAEEMEKEKVVKDALDKWSKDKAAKDEMNRVKPEGTKPADDKAMDAKITSIAEDVALLKNGGITKGLLQHIAQRDDLAEKLSQHIGTFDHSEKTLSDVAKYGCEKLGLKAPAGQEIVALDGFFHNRQSNSSTVFSMDSGRGTGGSKLKAVIKKAV